MKVSEIIQEFIPCETCGNNDINNFYFYVLLNNGSQGYVKCCECEEEYYSATAGRILAQVEESRKARKNFKIRRQDNVHPLIKVLAHI